MGHGVNTITRMPEAVRGIEKLELLVVCDPYPTAWSVLSERKDGTYLLPACTSFEMDGSRTASNRSLQWGEKIVEPVFESKNDYDTMYMLARKFGFADRMFKNIKVENDAVSAEDILREINRGGWSTGYCGQSPERLKAHMKNQAKFDLVTHAGAEGRSGSRRRLLRPAVAVLGNAGVQASRHADPLQHQSAGEGRRRHVPRPVRRRARRQAQGDGKRAGGRKGRARQSARRGLLFGRLRDQGRISGVHARRAQEARLGQGPHAQEMEIIQRVNSANPDAVSWSTRPFRRNPARGDRAWLFALRQRQGAHDRLESARSDSRAPRTDLHAASGSRRRLSDLAGRQAVPRAQYRLHRAEGGRRQRHRQAVSR